MALVFAVASMLAVITSAKLSQFYRHGPVPLSSAAELSWSVNFSSNQISFGLKVSDDALRKPGDAWIGIGVGEDTSGGMLGADIFTAEFADGVLDNCTVKDRHVPFVAYPLRTAPGAFPVEDSCQTDNSWSIVSCKRDLKNGVITLEINRPLDATTGQDRAIGPGEQAMMYAYGESTFGFHKGNRGSSRVVLYNADKTTPINTTRALPTDIVRNFTGLASNYTVPQGTTYACSSHLVPIPKDAKQYLVAIEPVLKELKGPNLVHHFVVYSCRNTNITRQFFETASCMDNTNNVKAGCSIIYGWAIGASRLTLPDDVGFPIDQTNNLILVETHFDNPKGAAAIDQSGIRIFLSEKRSVEAGVLMLGDFSVSMFNQTVKNNFNYTSTCPSNCTSKWADPYVNVFASGLHMHTTGKFIWTNKFNSDGSFNETMNAIEYWSNDHQIQKSFSPPKRIYRGDILSTTCNFDTSKKPNTKFGLETTDEMCLEFVWIYPAQRLKTGDSSTFNCGRFYHFELDRTISACGSDGLAALNMEENPSFEDTVGLPATFGFAPKTCALAANNNNNNNTAVCFPGSALVQTRTQGLMAMKDLAIGDEVSVGNGVFSPVFMFTHKLTTGDYSFVRLHTSHSTLRLSAGHHLYSNGRLTRADNINVGDILLGEDGTERKVTKISNVVETGLYNPQTMHGDIVVDGIITSTYTHAITPNIAHALLAPLRFVRSWLGFASHILETEQYNLAFVRKYLVY